MFLLSFFSFSVVPFGRIELYTVFMVFPLPETLVNKSDQQPGQQLWSNANNSGLMPNICVNNPVVFLHSGHSVVY